MLSESINKAKEQSCNNVFNFAILDTGILTLTPAKYSLNPETVISRNSIISAGIVSKSAITFFDVKISITAATNNLSAIGSKKVPKFVISFLILAK